MRVPPPPRAPVDPIALVDRIGRGDSAAEDDLVRFFHRDVFYLLRGRTRDPEVAHELSNDVLMAVVSALRAGRLQDATKLRAFVKGTLRNVANNYIRTRRARPPEEPLAADVLAVRWADHVEHDERMALVRERVARLPKQDRQIVLLTMMEGMKPGEIAARLGLSPESVRARKSRALQRLMTPRTRRDA